MPRSHCPRNAPSRDSSPALLYGLDVALETLDDAERELAVYGYSPALQAEFARRAAGAVDNAVKGTLAPLPEGTLVALPPLGSPARARLRALGQALLREGKVAALVLAGGMATRFGGVVKAVVEAYRTEADAPRSFLEAKHDDVVRLARGLDARIPTFVMSSFATHAAIEAHVLERGLAAEPRCPVEVFPQFVALRLATDGVPFRDASGALSPYATGHGDVTFALRRSGVLRRFREAGGTMLLMSNVDNLAATLDPAILGLHAELGGAITAEVVRKVAGDKGGAPLLLDGVPQIVEGFRFPPDYDQDALAVFNTNTFVLDAAAIDRDVELPYYRVEKSVNGAKAVQFERLVGELTALLPTRFVEVPRSGPDGRFLPAKDPDELARNRDEIAAIASARRSFDEG